MKFEEFERLSKDYNIIPVYEKITADLSTPVLAYLKLRQKNHFSFLLESVEGIGRLARYSFIGRNPGTVFYNTGAELTIIEEGQKRSVHQNLFDYLQQAVRSYRQAKPDDLPYFSGGIVGYLGYENIALIEDVIHLKRSNPISSPDSIFGIYDTIIAFDHLKHQIILIHNVNIEKSADLLQSYQKAKETLAQLRAELKQPLSHQSDFGVTRFPAETENRRQFYQQVEQARQYITDGDVFQMVLSRRFSAAYRGDLVNVYRALRTINPSPYMYYMEYGDVVTVIGTSPEDLLKVRDRKASILPIAGTRKRGSTPEEDLRMEQELLNDPKEMAEHVMLIDLARNDLGRVSRYGSVRVTEKINIQRFSHVMHIVSRVEGELQDGKDCIDTLKAAFPAGTLTGAPKIRAVQLIDSLEQETRNVYGGAIGYIDFSGNLDMCIAIRTFFATKDTIYWQAGAGIVADSRPELEWKEINNKAAVLRSALDYAGGMDEDPGH